MVQNIVEAGVKEDKILSEAKHLLSFPESLSKRMTHRERKDLYWEQPDSFPQESS
jgi:hypothetical protein